MAKRKQNKTFFEEKRQRASTFLMNEDRTLFENVVPIKLSSSEVDGIIKIQ